MANSNYLTWFGRLLILGAFVAGATASAAGAAGHSAVVRNAAVPDVVERYAIAHPYGTAPVPDVLERYAALHPFGSGLLTPATATDRIVDDWFRDPATVATPAGDRIVDDYFRDPTPIVTPAGERIVDDSFRDAARVPASTPSGDGLNWGDFGIGAGAMLGLMTLVAGLGLGAVSLRRRSGRLGTS